ncbi:unnamed protein product [Dicrocoelium dendriticum]|nr:unnamed protein product [Dicrocoelium dendriticum]
MQVLRKPETLARCNPKTGVERILETIPIIADCKQRMKLRVRRRRCRCQTQPVLIRKGACRSDCIRRTLWRRHVPTADGYCQPRYRLYQQACCCPKPQLLGSQCYPEKGILEFGLRVFRLYDGKCFRQDRFHVKTVECPQNERLLQTELPNGLIRVEKRRNIFEGCKCVPQTQVIFENRTCPAPTIMIRCTKSGPDLFVIETTTTRWRMSKVGSPCVRLNTVVDQRPVDCSKKELISAVTCRFDPQRHASVRIDRVLSSTNDGCRCVANPVEETVRVCHCMKAERRVTCDRHRGVLTQTVTNYELSGDRTRCVPHVTRRIWRPTCNPIGPQRVERTACNPATGLYYEIFSEYESKGCRCLKRLWRLPARCRCPSQIIKTRCLSHGIREVTTTSFSLTSRGTCVNTTLKHAERVGCRVPSTLFRPFLGSRVQRSPVHPDRVRHIQACGSGGPCQQKILEFAVEIAQNCSCRLTVRRLTRACCCPATSPNVVTPVRRHCDPRQGAVIHRKVDWLLQDGHCRPTVHEAVKPIDCGRHLVLKPIELCVNGSQKHVLQKSTRIGCRCVRQHQIVIKPCLCDAIGAAEVVFLVDESVGRRQLYYRERVHQLLYKAVELFLSPNHNQMHSSMYRFAVVKFASAPVMAFNLHELDHPMQMLERMRAVASFDSGGADLDRVLRFTLNEILPLRRPTVPILLYLITDGEALSLKNPNDWKTKLQTRYGDVQLNLIAMGGRPDRVQFMSQFVTQPKAIHLLSIPLSDSSANKVGRLVETLCKRACPANHLKQTLCSHKTGCIGRVYVHSYRFNVSQGKCVGMTQIKLRRCCCPHKPYHLQSSCRGNHVTYTAAHWQLTSSGACTKFVTKRDATAALIKRCSPPSEVRVGLCSANGFALEWTIRRSFDACKCKVTKSRRVVRCRCGPSHRRKRCIDDKLLITEILSQQLIRGECHPLKILRRQELKCPGPSVFKANCDTMTCQRRVSIVHHIPHGCRCERRVQVRHETCCCRGPKTVRYEGCKFDALKSFVEQTIEPALTSGACVRRTRHHFEPVVCPLNPRSVRHQCRHAPRTVGLPSVPDPALMVRMVEHFWWKIHSCECRQQRRMQMEACGCAQPTDSLQSRCNRASGVLVTYSRQLRLEVDGTRKVQGVAVELPDLAHARCRPDYKLVTVRKINCPKPKLFTTPCQPEIDGRYYNTVQLHRWVRRGCSCVNQAPHVVEKNVCECRRNRLVTQCRVDRPGGVRRLLHVKVIREKITELPRPDGRFKRVCKLIPPQHSVHAIGERLYTHLSFILS